MNFKVTMLTGAALAVMAGGAALASPAMADAPVPVAASYADLLEPVPDAAARIHADDQTAESQAMFQQAQWGGPMAHHHHHHHHSRGWYRHHGYSWQNGAWFLPPPPPPPAFHHHHHHHHHHHYWW